MTECSPSGELSFKEGFSVHWMDLNIKSNRTLKTLQCSIFLSFSHRPVCRHVRCPLIIHGLLFLWPCWMGTSIALTTQSPFISEGLSDWRRCELISRQTKIWSKNPLLIFPLSYGHYFWMSSFLNILKLS